MFTSPWQKPFRGTQINKAHPLAKGLVGCYVMNEASGDKVFDLSGYSNNGTNNGADWVADGLDFNGSSDYVEKSPFTTLTEFPYSLSVWVKATDTGSYMTAMFAGDNGDKNSESRIGVSSTGYFFISHNLDSEVVTISDIPADGELHHLVGTFGGYGPNLLYIDGVYQVAASGDGWPKINTLSIGRRGCNFERPKEWFDGTISNAMVYDRRLSPEEITYLYRKPYAMFEQPISPASLYYEAVAGITIPVLMHHYNQMMRA